MSATMAAGGSVGGGPAVGGGSVDGLSRCLAALCRPGTPLLGQGPALRLVPPIAAWEAGDWGHVAVRFAVGRRDTHLSTVAGAWVPLVAHTWPHLAPPPRHPPGAAALREEHALAVFVDAEGRSMKGGDKFIRFLAELHARIKSLVRQGPRTGAPPRPLPPAAGKGLLLPKRGACGVSPRTPSLHVGLSRCRCCPPTPTSGWRVCLPSTSWPPPRCSASRRRGWGTWSSW